MPLLDTIKDTTGSSDHQSKYIFLSSPEHLDNEIGQHMQKLEFGNWRCAICGWETKARARLWEHIESSHVQTNGYTCDICEKFCPSKNAFKVHKTRYHRNVV